MTARTFARRSGFASSLLLSLSIVSHCPAQDTTEGASADSELPPVPVREMSRRSAKSPSVDAGVMAGVCGVGEERLWTKTRFCLGGIFDALWARRREESAGFGFFAQVSSAGFRDLRTSLGPSALIPLGEWLVMGLRAGGLMHIENGVRPGGTAAIEWGQRSFPYSSHYSLSHSLFLQMDWSAATKENNAASALWIGLRVDGYWLSAPAMLFQ